MATEKTFYRSAANLDFADATKSLQATPSIEAIVSLATMAADADKAKSAGVNVGDLVYEATVRLAEFPPSDGGDDKPKEESESKDSGPSESESSDSSESSESSDGGDGGGDSKNPFGSEGGDEGDGDADLKGDKGIIHLLTEILHALKPGGDPLDPTADPNAGPGLDGPGGLPGDPGALPDVGAPPAGGALPPPGGVPPLPPPVPQKSPVGGPAFAHVLRRDSGELGNKAMIAEAAEIYPTYRVTKIQRTGSAKVNGLLVNLPESNAAVVTLVKKS